MENTKNIIDTLVSSAALVDSGFVHKYADNFGYNHLIKSALKRWDQYDPTYYVLAADPKLNYGLDFTIWILYKADGINFFKQMSLGSSSITNGGLRRVMFPFINNKTIVVFGSDYYEKGAGNRKALRDASNSGWIFA
jgi:hypothetical protein